MIQPNQFIAGYLAGISGKGRKRLTLPVTGVTLYRDRQIVVIATIKSTNRKTGPVVQVWVLDATQHPVLSRQSGMDAKRQCRGCPLASNKGCYVAPMALGSIYNKWYIGGYPFARVGSELFNSVFSGRFTRLGAYGNPSRIPLNIIEAIVELSDGHTGYFHDWWPMKKEKALAYGRYLMASAHPTGNATFEKARSLGLRTFTVTTKDQDNSRLGIECLAVTKGMTCRQCRLCDGTQRRDGTLPTVWIDVHGFQASAAKKAISAKN